MKKNLFSILLLGVSFTFASCKNETTDVSSATNDSALLSTELVQNPASATGTDSTVLDKMPQISFQDSVHDFGTIREGEQVVYEFKFSNTGKAPLLITGAHTSCGCTASDYPREPIAPGKSSSIKVKFDSKGKPGLQSKDIDLSTNAPFTPKLQIKGMVTGA